MAKYLKNPKTENIYQCAEQFFENCIIDDGSLLFSENLWTRENLEILHHNFIHVTYEGKDPFLVKFEKQIGALDKSVIRLAAELLALYYLFPSEKNISAKRKIEAVSTVLNWSHDKLDDHSLLVEAFESGVGGVGTAFLTYQYKEVAFILNVLFQAKNISDAGQESLADPWMFQSFIDSFPDSQSRQSRHILLHLFFPNVFERIATKKHKQEIVKYFHNDISGEYLDVDEELYSIRKSLIAKGYEELFDFYEPLLIERWQPNKASLEKVFSAWLSSKEHKPGAYYTQNTINTYINALKKRAEKLQGIELIYRNLFQYSDTKGFEIAYNKVIGAQNFTEINKAAGNGAMKAGMDRYMEFLQLVESSSLVEILKSLQVPQSELFRAWLIKTEDWVENTVSQSIKTLEETSSKILNLSISNPNLFQFTTLELFTPIFEQIMNSTNFKAVDAAAYNHSFSRGLKKYKEFLEVIGSGMATDNSSLEVLPKKYSITNIIQEGSFLSEGELKTILSRLESKKNLILQGPPGTGKTWLSKRLAYAFIGGKDTTNLSSMQFHATLSYEDFVQGWRPVGDGKLDLCKGPFLELIKKAQDDSDNDYVMVIEEINRGNPAQIFGELLTLLEADKRHEDEALQLCHQKDGECITIHIPKNLHIIGTMNIADRSLAIVDFALRRRFAFITLKPHFGEKWKAYMTQGSKANLPTEFADQIAQKMEILNKHITDDASLGEQYAIGHSYVTCDSPVHNPQEWFLDIVNTEIEPLLREYWFDDAKKVQGFVTELKEGI